MTSFDLLALAASGSAEELRKALAEAPAAAVEALVRTLAERSEVGILAELDATPVPAAVRKRVRAALHALRARGVRAPAAARVARLAPPTEVEAAQAAAEAWIAVPPPSVHLVLVPRDASGRRLLVALLDEQERVVEGGCSLHAGARGVREMIEGGSVGDAPFAPAPAGHVAGRLRAAVRRAPSPHGPRAAEARHALADGLPAAEALAEAPHPALALVPAEPEARASAAAVLTFDPADLPFALGRPTLDALLERLNTAHHSPLVLAPDLKEQRKEQILRAAVEQDLPPELVAGLGLRLLDRAWVRRSRDAERARREAAAGALLIERPDSPAARDVLRAFVTVHLRPPDEAGDKASVDASERRSRGGLILP